MRTMAIALSILLSAGGVQASLGQDEGGDTAPATTLPPKVIQLAGSPNKLGDKSLSGLAGGFYGIGGNEPKAKYFRSRVKKIPRCCAAAK